MLINNKFDKFVGIAIGIIITLFIVLMVKQCSNEQRYNTKSKNQKVIELRNSYNYFIYEATPKEIYIKWINKFFGCTYHLNGVVNRDEWDCSQALIGLLNEEFKANIPAMNVKTLNSVVEQYEKLKKVIIKTKYDDIQFKDILIWNIVNNYHVALIIGKSIGKYGKKYILYLDVTGKYGTMSQGAIEYRDIRNNKYIKVFQINFDLWKGEE